MQIAQPLHFINIITQALQLVNTYVINPTYLFDIIHLS